VTFSEAVTVTGTPQLTLATGTPSSTAVNYTSGSGTTVLTFRYTVIAGNTSPDLDATALSGGSITDAAGNSAKLDLSALDLSATLAGSKAIIIDTTAPSAPYLSLASYDSGTPGDAITNQKEIVLAVTAEAGSAVAITAATTAGVDVPLNSGAMTGAGAPRAFFPRNPDLSALADGTYVFSAVATDVAGNTGATGTFTVTIATAAPAAPAGLALSTATDTGTLASDGLTNLTSVTVTGTAASGTTVTVFDNGGEGARGSSSWPDPTHSNPNAARRCSRPSRHRSV